MYDIETRLDIASFGIMNRSKQSLAEKADRSGYALDREDDSFTPKLKAGQKRKTSTNAPSAQSNSMETPAVTRTFRKASDQLSHSKMTLATPSYIQSKKHATESISAKESHVKTPRNPYFNSSTAPPSSAKHHVEKKRISSSTHVVCAISENLARETCITYMDAGSPVVMNVMKLSNGQMYTETIAFLESLSNIGGVGSCGLDEILLNEGRKHSQLSKKIHEAFSPSSTENNTGDDTTSTKDRTLTGSCAAQTVVKYVPRSYFDQNRGAELLRNVIREGSYDQSVTEEYILLSSSYALLQYLQICLGANFAKNTVDILMNAAGKHRLAMDRGTIFHLELLANSKTGKIQHSLLGSIDSTKTSVGSRLLRSNLMAPPTRLDTITARLDLSDCFLEDETFFYEIMDLLNSMPDVEKMLTHIVLIPRDVGMGKDTLTGGKRVVTARMAGKGISALVCIKSALGLIPNYVQVLEMQLKYFLRQDRKQSKKEQANNRINRTSLLPQEDNAREYDSGSSDSSLSSNSNESEEELQTTSSSLLLGLGSGPFLSKFSKSRYNLLKAILNAMKNPDLKEILDSVLDIFTESTTYTRNSHAMRHQECFALKPNTDGMMDVLRKAFLANVDDIFKLADEYAEKFGFCVSVKESSSRGYYLSIPLKSLNSELPPSFIQPVKTGKCINCTTEEVMSLSARAQENVQDLLLLTHDRIQAVLHAARQKYDALASLSDAIALLDMCHSFADNVARSRLPWCRPIISDCTAPESISREDNNGVVGSGCIAIRNGRYGIDLTKTGLSSLDDCNGEDYIPNDTYASAFQNFTVITGINGSGKSTYLKQIAICVILAHCGSYVPAEEAFIPLRDRICTRIGTSDDQEHNISTFMQEMKDTAYICKYATDKSLILIDELGRATSNEDGVAIAWAIAEFLLIKRAITYFVTHYTQLCRLADVYPNVQNQHLEATMDENGIYYSHKILPGSCTVSADYGVEMAATCGWQRDVVEIARKIHADIECQLPDNMLCQSREEESNVEIISARNHAEGILNDLVKHLVALKASEDRLSEDAMKSYLQDLRDQYVTQSDPKVLRMISSLLTDNSDTCIPMLPLQPEGLTWCVLSHRNTIENTEPLSESSQTSTKNNMETEDMTNQTGRGMPSDFYASELADITTAGRDIAQLDSDDRSESTCDQDERSCDTSSDSSSEISSTESMSSSASSSTVDSSRNESLTNDNHMDL